MRFAVGLLTIFVLFAATDSRGQSGRKAKIPSSTPAPSVTASEEEEFSESKPNSSIILPSRSKNAEPKKVQEPAKSDPEPVAEDGTISVETSLVTVPVSVYERSGVYVGGLRRNDFKVFEDGVEQKIEYFGTTEQPFTVVLLIDTSPSTSFKIEEIQNAALAFVGQLSPADKVMVVTFDTGVRELTDFTNDRAQITKAIRRASFGGGTALYEAVRTALRKKLAAVQGRKAVVLFTDGVDTASRGANFDNTLALAEESDSTIFPIYYNTFFDATGIGRGTVMSTPPTLGNPQVYGAPTSADYARGRAYLQALADITGGQMYRAEATTGGLIAAFEGIAQELRSQYTIGYYPADAGAPGQRKRIKVRVNRPSVAVRTRDSYVVGENDGGKGKAGVTKTQ